MLTERAKGLRFDKDGGGAGNTGDAQGDAQGGDQGNTGDKGKTSSADMSAALSGGAQTTDPNEGGESSAKKTDTPPKTFSQADVDAIVGDRLARQKQQYGDYDDLKKKAKKQDEADEASKTEVERLQGDLTKATSLIQDLSAKNTRQERAGLVAKVAGTLGAVDLYDANFAMATQDIDPSEEGAEKRIGDLLTLMKTEKPHLFGKAQDKQQLESFNPGGSGAGQGAQETDTERRHRLQGSGGAIWDPSAVERQGGGVFFPGGMNLGPEDET